mmetsp:Transcript_90387/g.264476  ORF Transcript_90387/g.264476 Transcript_90387/m.264476 type:complete len:582 (-) Transcript_90387:438-2183(-)
MLLFAVDLPRCVSWRRAAADAVPPADLLGGCEQILHEPPAQRLVAEGARAQERHGSHEQGLARALAGAGTLRELRGQARHEHADGPIRLHNGLHGRLKVEGLEGEGPNGLPRLRFEGVWVCLEVHPDRVQALPQELLRLVLHDHVRHGHRRGGHRHRHRREDHGPQLRVLREVAHAQVPGPADAGAPEATEGRVPNELAMPIHPDSACAELVGEIVGLLQVGAPDRCPQTVVGAVCTANGLGVVLERHHGHHWPELLLIHQASAFSDTNHNGWQVEEAGVGALVAGRRGDGAAAADHAAALLLGVLDELRDVPQLHVAGQRPQLRALHEAVAELGAARPRGQRLREAVKDALMDKDALDGTASLTVVEERTLEDAFCCSINVAIMAYDRRIIATELQQEPLEIFGARGHDLAANRSGAREDHLPHHGVSGEDLPRPGFVPVRAHDDVEHAGGQHAAQQLADPQRRERRLRGRLEDHCVPAGQCTGGGLPTQYDGRIPWRNHRDHTQGAATKHNMLDAIVGDLFLGLDVQQPRGRLEVCGGDEELDAGLPNGPAALVRLQRRERLQVIADLRGTLTEAGGPL